MKILKPLIAIVLILGTVLALCACSSAVDTIKSQDGMWQYTKNDDGTITLVSINDLATKESIVVPQTIDGFTVSNISEKIFVVINDGGNGKKYQGTYADNNTLKSVEIQAQIKELPNMCFYICRKLENVVLPQSLQKIGDFAFYGCTSLTEIVIPASCNSLGAYTFRECEKLKSVELLCEEVPDIGDKCFYLIDGKASKDDQYYIIPNLQIKVVNLAKFDKDTLESQRKSTRNNSYKYWQEYSANIKQGGLNNE